MGPKYWNFAEHGLSFNFRMVTERVGGFYSTQILTAEPGTPWNVIYEQHTTVDSFMKTEDWIKYVIDADEKVAGYGAFETLYDTIKSLGRPCDLKFLWFSKNKSFLSFAFPKKSPFFVFFNDAIKNLNEKGVIERINADYEIYKPPNCKSQQFEALSLNKVVSLFLLLGLGCSLAIITLTLEHITNAIKKQN